LYAFALFPSSSSHARTHASTGWSHFFTAPQHIESETPSLTARGFDAAVLRSDVPWVIQARAMPHT
jgi:hypothetical protein